MTDSDKKNIENDYNNNLKNKHHLFVAKSQFIDKCFDLYSEGKMPFKVFKKNLKTELKAIKKIC